MKAIALLAALLVSSAVQAQASWVIYDLCPRCDGHGVTWVWLWQPLPYCKPCDRCGGLKVSPSDSPRPPTEVAP